MKTIWKYQITDLPICKIDMPLNATILTVGNQFEKLCLWVEVETENPIEVRCFEIAESGHELQPLNGEKRVYIGSVLMSDGYHVFHVYERKKWVRVP